MDHKEKCKKYYAYKKGYICYFCNVKATTYGHHNKTLEHHINMAKHLNIPIELLFPKGFQFHSNN
jgi:hypothetical protein